ncbi:MAG: tetratricopeptide repeat protein [Saprospiraceae bacterium]|nr:tetratricopeptide repeat protein [Saprospiraceae bacterium]
MENRTEYLLDAYFAHALTTDEADELKSLLQTNHELATEMRFRLQIARTVQDKSLQAGINNQDWAKAALPPTGGGPALHKNIWSRYLYAAAAMMAILVVAWAYIPGKDNYDIIASNTAFYPNKLTFKSLGQEALAVPGEVIQAFALYDKQQYPQAATALEAVVDTYPDNIDYRFYWGVTLIQTGQYSRAVQALEPIAQSANDYRTVSWYYLGLAYAGNKETDKAKSYLRQYIDAPDGVTYRKQVIKVLEEL